MTDNESRSRRTSEGKRLFVRSAMWTIIAVSLIAIGYFGAAYLSGTM